MLGGEGRGRARGEDEVHLAAHELSRELGELLALPFGVPDLKSDVLALDPAEIAESLSEWDGLAGHRRLEYCARWELSRLQEAPEGDQ